MKKLIWPRIARWVVKWTANVIGGVVVAIVAVIFCAVVFTLMTF